MLRTFEETYYPTLIVRPAEMQALEELPEIEKDRLFPILQICPWASSKSFENTHAKIKDVYGERPVICDIDRSYHSTSDREAIEYFNQLCSFETQCEGWIELIRRNEYYIPCVQMWNQTADTIHRQIRLFHELERGLVFRFNAFRTYDFDAVRQSIVQFLENGTQDDFCIVVDLGLIETQEFSENAAVRIIDRFRDLDDTRFIISSASFPRDFTFIDGMESIPIQSRQLFDLIRARYNNLNLSYSDWGSTKPRAAPGSVASAPLPRIDFPTNRRWISARSKSRGWTYFDASTQIIRSVHWENRPNVWGVQMIERTADGEEYAIDTSRKASSSRINIHLFTQNHFEADAGQVSTDEPWQDI